MLKESHQTDMTTMRNCGCHDNSADSSSSSITISDDSTGHDGTNENSLESTYL